MKWWKRDPHAAALLEDAKRRLAAARARDDEVTELTDYLRRKGAENHFGEKFHAALRPHGGPTR